MNRRSISVFPAVLALSGLFSLVAPPASAQYTVTLLTPANFVDTFAYGAGGGQQGGTGYGPATGGNSHALLWKGNAGSCVDLNPAGFSASYVYGADGKQQVGLGVPGLENHALVWNGSPTNYTDLNPSNFRYSAAYGVDSGRQVGSGRAIGASVSHAILWNNSPNGYVDLNPLADFDESVAQNIHGDSQIGTGITSADGLYHALLWHNTAASAIDLHPDGFDETVGNAVWDNEQAGNGYGVNTGGPNHALLWHGSATDYVDIHPAGYEASFLNATDGVHEAGIGVLNGDEHAMVWTGAAASAVDLHLLLPSQFLKAGITSNARGIDADGSVVGTVYDGVNYYGVRWTPSVVQTVTVSGRLALEGVPDLSKISPYAPPGTFHVAFRTPGTTTEVFSKDVILQPIGVGSPFGTFSIAGVPVGIYDVAFKGVRSLRTLLSKVTIRGFPTLTDMTLPAGDANDDNSVDVLDFGILVNAYGSDSRIAASGYDPAADFNFDGVVDVVDFGLLVNEYGSRGAN